MEREATRPVRRLATNKAERGIVEEGMTPGVPVAAVVAVVNTHGATFSTPHRGSHFGTNRDFNRNITSMSFRFRRPPGDRQPSFRQVARLPVSRHRSFTRTDGDRAGNGRRRRGVGRSAVQAPAQMYARASTWRVPGVTRFGSAVLNRGS